MEIDRRSKVRKLADAAVDFAVAIFGIAGVILGSYLIYWLLTSSVLHAIIFK